MSQLATRPDLVRAEGARLMRLREAQEHAKRAGLVTVSTTQKRDGDTPETLKVEHAAARFTRLQKNVGMAGKLHQQETDGRGFQVLFVTLTYRPGVEWDPAHMGAYADHVRKDVKSKTGHKVRYVWVAELQQRGALHYHVIFWVPRGYWMPKADKRGWWSHGMSKTEVARLSGGSVVYLMAYVKKHNSKEGLPRGARVFGVGGLDVSGRACRRWVNFPRFVQARASSSCKWRRAVGGGWSAPDGRVWPSEWGVSALGKGYTRVVRLRSYPVPAVMPSGPFSWVPGADSFMGVQ